MATLGDALGQALGQMAVPDLWQQQAVAALRNGSDVVVHAPTGAGKTLVFELWSNQGKPRGQAIYTVPTRALANDKLAEWRSRGWNVGISTGDLSENLDAPVLVATLETQKNRLLRGEGPSLLVIDEYQMLGDPERGLNYELAIAMAPPRTQLLLLSGSVANPQDLTKWLRRLGRDAVLVRHEIRPVPLEEVHAASLSYHVPSEIKGYWPRLVAKALAEDLGPILIFAPRRQAAEAAAAELARQLPTPNPLTLTPEQRQLVGEHLAKLLRSRIAYHHSGLSYAVRAGVIEPLAKNGQLRVVVATMGLAAGINFSLRSVALAGNSYRRDAIEQPLRPDEILQMFGRAGRRGIDETGYVLVTANEIRLLEAHTGHLCRSAMVDWSALLSVMHIAAERGQSPFAEAVRVQERLFSTKPIFLGVEHAMKHPGAPCGFHTDAERARHVRRRVRELLNSQGEWERFPVPIETPVGQVRVPEASPAPLAPPDPATETPTEPPRSQPRLRPMATDAAAVDRIGVGTLCPIETVEGVTRYGRAMTVADRLADGRILMAKWVRRMTGWQGRQLTREAWDASMAPVIIQKLAQQRTPFLRWIEQERSLVALTSLESLSVKVPHDRHGVALWKPIEREVLPDECSRCEWIKDCRELTPATGVALLWRRLGLIDAAGKPTRRGRIVSFFQQGDGLAIAAALEDETYDLKDLLYDLANLDAGFRFCGEENRWGGRLGIVCHERYGMLSVPGYLENGVPPRYGAGAELVVASVHENPMSKHAWITEWLGVGDIDRIIIEWRSLLRQVAHAPELDWPRWTAFQGHARAALNETTSPTLTALPPLDYHQLKRVDHKLILRRH